MTGELTVDRYEGIQNFEFSIPKNDGKMTKNSDRDSSTTDMVTVGVFLAPQWIDSAKGAQ